MRGGAYFREAKIRQRAQHLHARGEIRRAVVKARQHVGMKIDVLRHVISNSDHSGSFLAWLHFPR
jgi:hypothetical protein